MSKIAEQIKQLQLKQTQIEYLELMISYVESFKDDKFNDAISDLKIPIVDSFKNLIKDIESNSELSTKKISLSTEEVELLKTVASKIKNKPVEIKQETNDKSQQSVSKQPSSILPQDQTQDKLGFALQNRHLANKLVRVLNDKNMDVRGLVVGLDAPNVLVKVQDGPTIQVPIQKIEALG